MGGTLDSFHRPKTADEARKLISAWPDEPVVSTGRNWGYARPIHGIKLDRLTRIDMTGRRLIVEPGVTQGMAHDWLKVHGWNFRVPTTGAGPDCSLIGNAMAGGFGPVYAPDHRSIMTVLDEHEGVVLRAGFAIERRSEAFRLLLRPHRSLRSALSAADYVGLRTGRNVTLINNTRLPWWVPSPWLLTAGLYDAAAIENLRRFGLLLPRWVPFGLVSLYDGVPSYVAMESLFGRGARRPMRAFRWFSPRFSSQQDVVDGLAAIGDVGRFPINITRHPRGTYTATIACFDMEIFARLGQLGMAVYRL